jgi:hypothetical protein
MEKVFPAPVYPYAIIVPEYPPNALCTNSFPQISNTTS